ncbi:MAG: oligosaccharide flippase family protein [Planctomycetes bacterium]|nr:oligosaccharide flippase family protein [Planctomycetota bacterium]
MSPEPASRRSAADTPMHEAPPASPQSEEPAAQPGLLRSLRAKTLDFVASERLGARCARGGAALAAGTVVERAARLARNMILARLLAPEHFGLMALVTASSHFFEAMTEAGVRYAVVQNKRGDTEEFLNAAWWFNTVRGLLLFLIGLALAPAIAVFYEEPLLTAPLRVAFLTLLLTGAINPRLYVLQKQLQFGKYVAVVQGSGLAATIVTLVIAIFVRNVWALVVGLVAGTAIQCAASMLLCPFRPSFRLERDSARELLRFARGIFGLPLLTFLVVQADVFVLGKVCTKEVLGMYSLALVLAQTPVMIYSQVAQPLIVPVLSGFQDDRARLRTSLFQLTRAMLFFGAPLAVVLAVLGGPILTLVYGEAYAAMAVPFGILSAYMLVYAAGTAVASTYVAVGKPELHRRFTLIRAVLVAAFLYPAARQFGPAGAAACLLACLTIASFFQLPVLRKVIGLEPGRYAASGREGLALAFIVAVPALLIASLWQGRPLLQVVSGGLVCAAVWSAGALYLRSRGSALAARSAPLSTEAER